MHKLERNKSGASPAIFRGLPVLLAVTGDHDADRLRSCSLSHVTTHAIASSGYLRTRPTFLLPSNDIYTSPGQGTSYEYHFKCDHIPNILG